MTVLKSFLFIVILLGVGLLGCLAASGRALHPITPAPLRELCLVTVDGLIGDV